MKIHRSRRAGVGLLLAATLVSGCGGGGGSGRSAAAAVTSATNPTGSPGGGAAAGNGATAAYARLNEPRAEHAAASIAAGVLVTGGEAQGRVLASAELYQAGAWRGVGSLRTPRKGHSATALSNGLVLVAGGQQDLVGQQVLNTSELFDPATNTFRAGPLMQQARTGHVAVAFRSGQGEFVLLAGGAATQGTLASVELYDVTLGQFVPVTAPLRTDRIDARAQVLPSGKVLLQGGLAGITPTTFSLTIAGAEVFDPATRTFAPAGTLGIDRFGAALALLDGGKVLIAGGASPVGVETTAELYDPATNAWSPAPAALAVGREGLSSTALPGGGVLLAGGADAAPLAAVERYDAIAGAFVRAADLLDARRDHTATLLPNGRVLLVGGHGASGAVATSEEYDPRGAAAATPPTAAAPGQPLVAPGTTPPPATSPPAADSPPSILAVFPSKGKPGDLITIAGRHFAPKKDDNTVVFAGNVRGRVLFEVKIKRLPFLGAVETLVVEVPQGAQTGDLVVVAGNQASRGKSFRIDLQSGSPPSILYTLPRRASVGGLVTIFGRNFANPARDNVVRFSGVQANLIGGITTQSIPFLGSVSVMLVRVPTGAVTGPLTIEAYGRSSGGYGFEVPGTSATTPPPAPSPSPAPSPGMTTFFAEDFEGNTLRFGAQGGVWQAAIPRGTTGPARAASGSWCAGTAMTQGSYSAGARGYLISREVDLTQAVSAELRFNQWFETDGVDAGRVIVSPDNGTTYYLVRPQGGYRATSIFTPAEGFTGQSGAWLSTTCDLSRFVGSKILVIFDFKADASGQRAGWFVDDVHISGY